MPLFNPPAALVTGLRKGAGTEDRDVAATAGVDYAVPSETQQVPNGLLSGGGVLWTGSLNFTVSAATYIINGVQYTSSQTNLTLGAANATYDRIDVIAVNSSGAAVVIAGTASASPALPAVDPSSQLQLTFVYVAANAATPSNVTTTTLYAENAGSPTEWTSSVSGAGFNAASTSNPHAGTKDIEATSVTTGNYAQLQKPSGTLDLTTQNSVAFYIRSKASWGNRTLTIAFLNAGTQVGNAITFKEGSFGFNSANSSGYQQIIIPISQFAIGASAINQLRFTVGGSGGGIGFYLDDITLQSGVAVSTLSGLPTRQSVIKTTVSLANNAVEDGTLSLGYKTAALVQIQFDRACRVRLYATTADRTTDTGPPDRSIYTDPAPGQGMLAEFLVSAAKTLHVAPVVSLSNQDSTPNTNLYYRIENRSGSTSTVTVTLIVVPQEQ
jgi:hypothetical protein